MEQPKNMSGACYKCKHRANVPGSVHSACVQPQVKEMGMELAMVYASGGAIVLSSKSGEGEDIPIVEGNPHGRRRGWFTWPLDFDPVWLESCLLMEEKEE